MELSRAVCKNFCRCRANCQKSRGTWEQWPRPHTDGWELGRTCLNRWMTLHFVSICGPKIGCVMPALTIYFFDITYIIKISEKNYEFLLQFLLLDMDIAFTVQYFMYRTVPFKKPYIQHKYPEIHWRYHLICGTWRWSCREVKQPQYTEWPLCLPHYPGQIQQVPRPLSCLWRWQRICAVYKENRK